MIPNRETIQSVLDNTDPQATEQLAQQATDLTRQYFGRAISIYTPLYISNFCSSHCTYCGFHHNHSIKRIKLTPQQIKQEAQTIAQMGIQDLLLLTGESYDITPLSYLKEAVQVCKPFFPNINMEIYALEETDYRELFYAGVDGVTIYQETYNRQRYQSVHLGGKKQDYDFRYHAPERIARSGIRRISMGILMGLAPLAEDLFALFEHLKFMERSFPGVEYSVSFPRLKKIKGQSFSLCNVSDIDFIKAVCLTRIAFPRIGINLSTRESESLRNHTIGIGITRISAASNTSVGGYSLEIPEEQAPQFDIEDNRTLDEILRFLKDKHFDPVLTDWRRI